jgi:hypothetical protein
MLLYCRNLGDMVNPTKHNLAPCNGVVTAKNLLLQSVNAAFTVTMRATSLLSSQTSARQRQPPTMSAHISAAWRAKKLRQCHAENFRLAYCKFESPQSIVVATKFAK